MLPSAYGSHAEISQNQTVVQQLYNKLEKFAESPTDDKYLRYTAYKMSFGRARFFLCPPHLLDTTQPEDVSNDVTWELVERRKDKLSCAANLRKAVTNNNALYSKAFNKYGVIPEYNAAEKRRCIYIHPSGVRCTNYGDNAICTHHMRAIMNTPSVRQEFTMRSTTLQEAYQKHLNSPNRKSLDSELALMRGCLDLMLQRLNMDTAQDVGIILQITEKITGCLDKMSGIEARLKMRMTPEQVNDLLIKTVGFVTEIFQPSPEQLRALADKLESTQTIIEVEGYPVNGSAKLTTPLTRYSEQQTHVVTKESHLKEQILKHESFSEKTNISERNRDEASKSAQRAKDELAQLNTDV